MDEMEAEGLKELHKTGFVLIAGGLCERIWYSGIKIDLPVSIIEKDYLPYVAAGFSTIKYNQSATYTSHTDGSEGSSYDFSATSSNSGYKLGHFLAAGIETKLHDNASIRVEYRYSDYGKIHLNQNNDNLSFNTGTISPMSGSSYLNIDSHLTQQTIKAVLSYDF
jgi:opacity protein-like surface antigen